MLFHTVAMFKSVLKFLFRATALVLFLAVVLLGWLRATAATIDDLPALKSGDLVFQTSRSNQSIAIMLASKSPYSHMGIVEVLPGGTVVVLEAVATVRETPLADWEARGGGGRLLVKRLATLSPQQAQATTAAARSHFGKPYDLFFRDGRDAIYCSELANLAFRDGAGLAIGTSQRVGDLDIDNFAARKLIELRWQKHPDCAKDGAATFDQCYARLLEQHLVTPDSVAGDAKLVTVFSNYGVLGE